MSRRPLIIDWAVQERVRADARAAAGLGQPITVCTAERYPWGPLRTIWREAWSAAVVRYFPAGSSERTRSDAMTEARLFAMELSHATGQPHAYVWTGSGYFVETRAAIEARITKKA